MPVNKYAGTAIAGGIICLGLLGVLGVLEDPGSAKMFRILCDGFFVTAVLLMGFGFLTAVNAAGFFNIFGYSAEVFICAFAAESRRGKRYRDFNEYGKSKNGKRRAKWHFVTVGGVYLVFALVFLALEAKAS